VNASRSLSSGDAGQLAAADLGQFRPGLECGLLAGFRQHAQGSFDGARQAGHDHPVEADAVGGKSPAGGCGLRAAGFIQGDGLRQMGLPASSK